MPLRENQVYQIGLITAVMLMVVAGGFGYYGISSSQQQANENRKLVAKINDLDAVSRSARNGIEVLLGIIGQTDTSNIGNNFSQITDPDIKTKIQETRDAYSKVIQSYGVKDENANKKTLFSLIDNLIASLGTKNNLVRNSNENQVRQKEDYEQEYERFKQEKASQAARITKLEGEKESLDRALKAAKQDFNQKFARAEEDHAKAITALEDANSKIQKQLGIYKVDLDEQTKLANSLEVRLRKFERTKFLIPDGYVVDVIPATGKVYVNLGHADGLYPRVSFSVFGDGVPLEAGKEKGAIEIMRVISDHQAEARIVNYDPKDPIIRRDRVVTATWDPGQSVRVAIAGIVDFDDDGVSDLTQLKGLIRKNRGTLVAEANDKGQVLGKVDVNTQFLIVGEVPGNKSQSAAFSKMVAAADKYRVRQISVRDFLHLNGYHPEPTIKSLLKNEPAKIEGFKRRRPPAGGSAFGG